MEKNGITIKWITTFAAGLFCIVAAALLFGTRAFAGGVIDYEFSYTDTKVRIELFAQSEENTIYFTMDGSKPNESSMVYQKRLSGTKYATLRAVEKDADGKTVATLKTELKPPVNAPSFTTYAKGTREYLDISTSTQDAEIYYTTDGSKPTRRSEKYTESIKLSDGMTVRAVAYKEKMKQSPCAEYEYERSVFLEGDEQAVYEKLNELREEYPEGTPWDEYSTYGTSSGCAAFAFMLTDKVFGDDAPKKYIYDFDFSDLRVGNIIRTSNDYHSVVVIEINEDSVVVAEGNYADRIGWTREISRRAVENASYIIVRYADQFTDEPTDAEPDNTDDSSEPEDDGSQTQEPGDEGSDAQEPGDESSDVQEPGDEASDTQEPGDEASDTQEPEEENSGYGWIKTELE